jgi:hypothetical protein
MIQGFDIPLSSTQVFERAAERSKTMLANVGIELIPIATNFRQLGGQDWADVYVAAVVSCLMLFQKEYAAALIPGGEPYQALPVPWASHPMADRLLSSDTFTIIHDGAAFARLEKMEQLMQWTEARENLQVCWEMPEKGGNCGRCEKCLRTILCFRLLGKELPECFDRDVTNLDILTLAFKHLSRAQHKEIRLIVSSAKNKHISDAWVSVLEIALLANPVVNPLKEALKKRFPQVQNVYRKLLNSQ